MINKVSLQDPVEITGVAGDSVILPCTYKETELKPEKIFVFWRYNQSNNVFDIENGISSTEDQHPMFKDRIESSPSEYAKGNFSIRLKRVSFIDIGEFSCFIQNVQKEQISRLHVRAPPPTTTMSIPNSKTDTRSFSMKTQPDGILPFLTAVLFSVSNCIGVLLYC
ncbi:CD276 antigen homolog isoform X2 [Labeo rohita]|nr:CD276 antigen homolog isoform X2 [Labeo rohita]